MGTPPIVKIVRPHAIHLKLRAEPIAECQEYVGEVDDKQHVRLLDCGWEVVNGFLLVAALITTLQYADTSVPATSRSSTEISDTSL